MLHIVDGRGAGELHVDEQLLIEMPDHAGQRLEDVRAAPHPAVEYHGNTSVYGPGDVGKNVERCGTTIELATTMIGDIDAGRAGVDGEKSVLWRLDPLDDHGKMGVVGDAPDILRADLPRGLGVDLHDAPALAVAFRETREVRHGDGEPEVVDHIRLTVSADGGVDGGMMAFAPALIRLAGDHWIAQAQPAAGTRAATWTIDHQDAIHPELDTARSQGAARPAGAGSQWRNLLLDQFTTRFNLARHDIFTSPHALGLAAEFTYARLNDPGITPDQEHLHRLAVAGLIVMTPNGWQRTTPRLRDLAAQRHGVAGRLTHRQHRYASERDQWSWWNAELEWMTTPGRHRRRQPTGQIALSLGQPWDMYPPYPRRAGGRAGHSAARTMIATGILDPLHRATLATAA